MRKKIILLAAALMMFMGVVSASSINGDYKGNPIVKVLSNGVALQTDEVPAMIYDGHTVVPISLLRQIGASVEWNQNDYSVDVKLPQTTTSNSVPNIQKMKTDLSNEVNGIDYSLLNDGTLTQLTFYLKFDLGIGETLDKFNKILVTGSSAKVVQMKLIDQNPTGSSYLISVGDVNDLFSDKITSDQFLNKIQRSDKIVQQPQTSQPSTQPQPTVNNGNVQNGDSGNFQFVGVTDFVDKYGSLHITGQVKNITGKDTVGGVEVTVTLFNQNGNVVATRSGYANGASTFMNGESAPFDILFTNFPENYTRFEIKVKS